MAALSTLGNGSGYLYIVDLDGTSIISNITNTPENVRKIILDASVVVGLIDDVDIFSNIYGKRYFLDAAGVAGVLSGTEITQYIVTRGLNAPIQDFSSTIATGVITPGRYECLTYLLVDTQGSAASDDLDTITSTNFVAGDIIFLRGVNSARVVTVKNGTGNITLANSADFDTGTTANVITLQWTGSVWNEITRSPNPALSVATLRAAGIATPVQGVETTALTNGGGTINLEPGVDKGYQVYTGTITMSASWTIQIQAAPATPYLDGDEMYVDYRTLATTGANTVTIFGIELTTTQALEGRVILLAKYKLSNTTWYYTILYKSQGVDITNKAYVDATFEPVLGNPAGDGYILSSLTDGTRSWIPNPSAVTPNAVFTDAADRAAYFPAFIGQQGTQIDTNTEYVAYGLAAGEWKLPANTQVQSDTYAVATGTDTYAITLIPALAAYAAGNSFKVLFTNGNTTASTINVNALGAKAIKKNASVALVAGDIIAGKEYILTYDGTNFQIESNDSQVKNVQVSADKYAVASGTNTYAITLSPAPAAYAAGNIYNVTFTNANTAASTINVNTLGAKNIFYNGIALVGGEIIAATGYSLLYDGTQFHLIGTAKNTLKILKQDYGTDSSGTGEDTLFTYTVPANTLSATVASCLEFFSAVDLTNASGDTVNIKIYVGTGAIYTSGPLVVGASVDEQCIIKLRVVPLTSASAFYILEIQWNDTTTFSDVVEYGVCGGVIDWTSTTVIKLTGERSVGAGTIDCPFGQIMFQPQVTAT